MLTVCIDSHSEHRATDRKRRKVPASAQGTNETVAEALTAKVQLLMVHALRGSASVSEDIGSADTPAKR